MTQKEILAFLKENSDEAFSSKGLAIVLDCNIVQVTRQLRQLRKFGLVSSSFLKGTYYYSHKR